jgi:hypothetical protein
MGIYIDCSLPLLFTTRCDYGKTCGNHVISVVNTHICSELKAREKDLYKHLYLTFDNCAVNKNYMMVGYEFISSLSAVSLTSYMVLLVMNGKFESVQVNYPVAGHTKFGPDGMFGWLGPLLRNFDLYEIDDIVTRAKGAAHYSVEKIDPALLLDYTAFISDHILKSVNGINARHQILVTKTEAGCKLQLRDYSSAEWVLHKQFNSPLPPFKATKLVQQELSAAKVKDLLKQEKYSPTGLLSYAHYESAPPANNTNDADPDAMQVENRAPLLPLPADDGNPVVKNCGIACYKTFPTGIYAVYVVKLRDGQIVYSLLPDRVLNYPQ